MNLVIDRKTWLRGDDCDSMLYRPSDRKMCCLGFYGCAMGLSKRVISSRFDPGDLPDKHKGAFAAIGKRQGKLIAANDATDITEKQRERRVTQHFKACGVSVKFIN